MGEVQLTAPEGWLKVQSKKAVRVYPHRLLIILTPCYLLPATCPCFSYAFAEAFASFIAFCGAETRNPSAVPIRPPVMM